IARGRRRCRALRLVLPLPMERLRCTVVAAGAQIIGGVTGCRVICTGIAVNPQVFLLARRKIDENRVTARTDHEMLWDSHGKIGNAVDSTLAMQRGGAARSE